MNEHIEETARLNPVPSEVKDRHVLVLTPKTDPATLWGVVDALPEWGIFTASNAQTARVVLRDRSPRVGLAIIDTPATRSLRDIEEVILESPAVEWIALVSRPSLEMPGFARLLAGVFYDHHSLPIDQERLSICLGHAYGKALLREALPPGEDELGRFNMVGASSVMRQMYRDLLKIPRVDAAVLITGESGTGKELAARAIHDLSVRREGPFVAVNCGALPAHLIQSELFGHEKGAFTGAHQRKIGRIEAAQDGTIFLDEIGDLPLELQVNLLRFLEDRCIERVGSSQKITVRVRVIAATHVDLEKAVHEGRFREDLYYRLNVLHLRMPPLREREGDIELLAHTYFDRFVCEKNLRARGFSQEALRVMRQHHWPGNVRELINRVQRAVVMGENRLVTVADLGLEKRAIRREATTLAHARTRAEVEAIRGALRSNNDNISEAARQLGVSRITLYRLMSKFHLSCS